MGDASHPFRQISRSLVEMAVITGVVVRVLHAVFNAHGGATPDWHALVGRFVVVPVVLLALAAVHLANYPVRQWLWRAPSFAALEGVVGAVSSLVLIEVGRERWGTGRALAGDWPRIAAGIFVWHVVIVCLFALILGGIVQLVRRREVAAEHRHEHLLTHPPVQHGESDRTHGEGKPKGD